ncbi:MAG: hypothetical protein ACFFDF_11935 [Candidatus Odinarchaeota archaeon]
MINDINKIFEEKFEPTNQQLILDYSKVFISFLNVNESTNPKYIYIGNEKMLFKERHSEYQKLFIHEFLTYKKCFVKSYS